MEYEILYAQGWHNKEDEEPLVHPVVFHFISVTIFIQHAYK